MATARDGGYVIVWAGRHAWIVMPNREKALGEVRDDQVILAVETRTAAGVERDYIAVEPDDPRVVRS